MTIKSIQKGSRGKINKNDVDFVSGKFYILIVVGQTVNPEF